MTSTQNPQKIDPPPSPIHMCPQYSNISGAPVPLNGDAGVSNLAIKSPTPSPGKLSIISLFLIISGTECRSMKINGSSRASKPQIQSWKYRNLYFSLAYIKNGVDVHILPSDPPPSPHPESSTVRNFRSVFLTPSPYHTDVIYVCSHTCSTTIGLTQRQTS